MRNLLCAGYNYFLLLSSLLPSSFFPFLLSFIILIHLQYNTSATSYSNAAQESLAMRRAVISLSSLLCPIPTSSPLSFSLSLLLSFSPSLLIHTLVREGLVDATSGYNADHAGLPSQEVLFPSPLQFPFFYNYFFLSPSYIGTPISAIYQL